MLNLFPSKSKPVVLDLFCGLWGWSEGFISQGWNAIGIDLKHPMTIPEHALFGQYDVLDLTLAWLKQLSKTYSIRAIVCSSPCEQFSVHCMKHFHPNPPYPTMGIKLFRHAQALCESSGLPYIMENVRCAQKFIGYSVDNCGPFHLWGNAVPHGFPENLRNLKKGFQAGGAIIQKLKRIDRAALTEYRRSHHLTWSSSKSEKRKRLTAQLAKITFSLSSYIASTIKP